MNLSKKIAFWRRDGDYRLTVHISFPIISLELFHQPLTHQFHTSLIIVKLPSHSPMIYEPFFSKSKSHFSCRPLVRSTSQEGCPKIKKEKVLFKVHCWYVVLLWAGKALVGAKIRWHTLIHLVGAGTTIDTLYLKFNHLRGHIIIVVYHMIVTLWLISRWGLKRLSYF